MYSLEEALKTCEIKSLFEHCLKYKDFMSLPNEADENSGYCTIMKFYQGIITKEEYEEADDKIKETRIYKLYEKYIFSSNDWRKIKLEDEDIK